MKKIALLNLAIDDNYGGNLQRYALVHVLEELGYDVTHLLIMRRWTLWQLKTPLAIAKRLIERFLLGRKKPILIEKAFQKKYMSYYHRVSSFYERHIKHSAPIYNYKMLKKYNSFDAYIVGSDQVWRECMIRPFPMRAFFFSFSPQKKHIAYAVSLGTDVKELDEKSALCLKKYYEKFQAVSVREKSALEVFEQYGWNNPKADWLIDPTFLLPKEEYLRLTQFAETEPMRGNMFCYILDPTEEKQQFIKDISNQRGLTPFETGLHEVSIEQWIRNIAEAEYVVTDSYHGFVFSMIFNKPVKLFFNEIRGNARFESLLSLLELTVDQKEFNWDRINEIIASERQKAVGWLNKALQN